MNLNESYVLEEPVKGLLFVGDTHFSTVTPRSRIDEYPKTALKKMREVHKICKEQGFSIVVLLGDIFNKPSQPISYVNSILDLLAYFKKDGIEVYSIIGNHDVLYNRLDFMDKSSLGNLFYSGLLKPFGRIYFKTESGHSFGVAGFHYGEMVKPAEEVLEGVNIPICVAHLFYNMSSYSDDYLSDKQVKELGYKFYALGHDHITFNPVKVDNSYVIRPGSLMRGTSHRYNLSREVVVQGLKFDQGDKPVKFKSFEIPTANAEDVFTSDVYNRKVSSSDLLIEISAQAEELLEKMDGDKSGRTIYDVLDESDIDEDVKSRIELYLQQFGIFRRKSS